MTVVSALEALLNVAVTVVAPPFSAMDEAASANVTIGGSSSVTVPVPVPAVVEIVAPDALLRATRMVSSASSTVSPVTETSKVRLVVPAAKVSVPATIAV